MIAPKHRRPIAPGEVLRSDFLELLLRPNILACLEPHDQQIVNEIVYDNKAITATMARCIGRLTQTSADYWINLQQAVDQYDNR